MGRPRVDDERQSRLARRRHVTAEEIALHVVGRVLAEVVETGLPDRVHLGMAGLREEMVEIGRRRGACVMRVDTDRHEDPRIDSPTARTRGQSAGAMLTSTRIASPGFPDATDHSGAVLLEGPRVHVGMGVDHAPSSSGIRQPRHTPLRS